MPYNFALIGYGYWGPVLLRNFSAHPAFTARYVCDRHAERAADAARVAPSAKFVADSAPLFDDPSLDVVIIATQAASHAALIRRALESGKHVFVEKPMTLDVAEAESLCALAAARNRALWVDHTFLFNPAYAALKAHLPALGKLRRFHSTRAGFGRFQTDADIFWHLAYHDAYLLCDLFPTLPTAVTAAAASHVVPQIADAAIVNLTYADGVQASLLADMNFPEKKREIILSGATGSLVWDETRSDKLRLFRHGATCDGQSVLHDMPAAPEILPVATNEALALEVAAFAAFLSNGGAAPCQAENTLPTLRLIAMIRAAADSRPHY